MCGIAGIIDKNLESLDYRGANDRVRGLLMHRGPDDFGEWSEGRLRLFHWRLSILDLSPAGHQPMLSRDGRFVICYNGEVYNFRELRDEIARANVGKSFPWRGHSDTEVILEGFSRFGESFLSRLNGMFALAVYDRQSDLLWLARDRAGIKPLFLSQSGDVLQFASEPKFFSIHPSFRATVSSEGLAAYLTYGHSTGRCRMLAGVRQIDPGEVLCVRSGNVEGSRRLAPRASWTRREWSDAGAIREVRELLRRVVERQVVADVPVGVLLSGGVDSAILTALTARILGPSETHAFTLVYPEYGKDFNEVEEAQAVARHLGVRHHVMEARATDLIANLESLVWHYDEPFADAAALNVMMLSRLVREHVSVALAGEGSDELFGGYRRYRVERWFRRFPRGTRVATALCRSTKLYRLRKLPRRLQIFLRSLSHTTPADRYAAYLQSGADLSALIRPEWRPHRDVRDNLRELFADIQDTPPIATMCLVDQQFWLPDTYLEKSDKGSMAASLEMRVPYLDNEVVEFANSLPDRLRVRGQTGKWLLREAFRELVPPGTFDRFKRGFSVPIADWFRDQLGSFFADRVLGPSARSANYLDQSAIARLFAEHRSETYDRSSSLWQVLLFEIWLGRLARGADAPSAEKGAAANVAKL